MYIRPVILQVLGGSPKKKGSLEEYFLFLSRKLYDDGYMCIFVFNDEIEESLRKLYVDAHAEIVVLRGENRRFDIRMIFGYIKLFRHTKPAIVNFHFGNACFHGLIASYFSKVRKTVWTKHSFYDDGPFYNKLSFFKKFFSLIFLQGHLVSKNIVISEGLKKELREYFISSSRIKRIYLGINLGRFSGCLQYSPLPSDINVTPDKDIISCFSQARHEKGLEYLVRAMKIVLQKWPSVHLVLVGGGPLTEDLIALAEALGIASNISFVGVRNDVEKILQSSLFTILPSISEGISLALLEAQAVGKPSVASCVGGVPEVIIDGANGVLVSPKDVGALADKILLLLSDRKLLDAMKMECLEKAGDFDVKFGVADTIAVYKELLLDHV